MVDWFKANYPKTTFVFKRKGGGGFDVEDKPLWAEIQQKANGVIIGLGHWSQCAPAVVGHSVNFETKMKIPAVPIVISEFYQQETDKARNEGLPGLRIEWIRGPVWGKTREQLRRDVINGNNPITGKPVMQPEGADKQPCFQPTAMEIIVTGGTNNNYYSIGGLQYNKSVQIDPWR